MSRLSIAAAWKIRSLLFKAYTERSTLRKDKH
jgi:hypothetical protein